MGSLCKTCSYLLQDLVLLRQRYVHRTTILASRCLSKLVPQGKIELAVLEFDRSTSPSCLQDWELQCAQFQSSNGIIGNHELLGSCDSIRSLYWQDGLIS